MPGWARFQPYFILLTKPYSGGRKISMEPGYLCAKGLLSISEVLQYNKTIKDMGMDQKNIAIPPESTLIPLIQEFGEEHFGRKFRTNNLSSETEISAGFGVADVVFYQLDNEIVEARKSLPLEAIQSEDIIKTLLLIPKNKKRVSLTYLANKLPIREGELKKKVLKFLEDRELLCKSGDEYLVNFHYDIGLLRCVAIEAKIKDWQRGLYQAYRYKWFADYSYLALYKDFIEQPKKNIHLFEKLNIGLISVGDNEVRDVVFNPVKEKPQSRIMTAVAFERLLERVY